MNRDPNVVTRGLGERMVKPATEILWAGFLFVAEEQNNERQIMSLLKRLCREENGQGLTEYTLVIVLVALVFWIGVRDTQVGQSLAQGWAKVLDCIASPFLAPLDRTISSIVTGNKAGVIAETSLYESQRKLQNSHHHNFPCHRAAA